MADEDDMISTGVDGNEPDPDGRRWLDEPDHVYERLYLRMTYPRLPTDDEVAAAEAWAKAKGYPWPVAPLKDD